MAIDKEIVRKLEGYFGVNVIIAHYDARDDSVYSRLQNFLQKV